MFEKIGRSAERVVSKVSLSRRGFLGRLARGAAVLGGTLGGVLWMASEAEAAGGGCCISLSTGYCVKKPKGGCPWGTRQVHCRSYSSCPQ
jgi:hypothetical protein